MKRARDRRFRRGAYLLPTLFTVGNLFCGFYSVVATVRGRFEVAALLIMVAALLDALDGRVARFTSTTTDFGQQLDSLCDTVSFGVAPALMIQAWALQPFPRAGWLVAFLFLTCGVVRLARFNIQTGIADKRYFIGLPIPAAAIGLASCVTLAPEGLTARWMEFAALLLMPALSLLMVSKLRFRSFKDLDLRGRVPSVVVVVVALAFIGVASDPPVVLLILGLAYLVSGLLPRRVMQRWTEGRSASSLRASEVEHGDEPS